MAEEKKGKRPVAHKVAIQLIKKQPQSAIVFAEMYRRGTVVPTKDIPELVQAFQHAKTEIPELINEAIRALNIQAAEARAKKRREEAEKEK